MSKKIDVEVVIGGKQYTVCGYESNEYVQQIANHINGKLKELRGQEGYARLESDIKNVLLAINLTDDFQKAQKTIESLRQENKDMEKELFDMKHEMIAMQTKLQEAQKDGKECRAEKDAAEKKIIRLEAELEQYKKMTEKEPLENKEVPSMVVVETKDAPVASEEKTSSPDVSEPASGDETQEGQEIAKDASATTSASGEEIGKEIAATMGKPSTEKKPSRSSRKKRR